MRRRCTAPATCVGGSAVPTAVRSDMLALMSELVTPPAQRGGEAERFLRDIATVWNFHHPEIHVLDVTGWRSMASTGHEAVREQSSSGSRPAGLEGAPMIGAGSVGDTQARSQPPLAVCVY